MFGRPEDLRLLAPVCRRVLLAVAHCKTDLAHPADAIAPLDQCGAADHAALRPESLGLAGFVEDSSGSNAFPREAMQQAPR
jgi:hypothetical protein